MCYGTIHSFDIEDCCCDDPLTEHHFEKERFSKVIKQKNQSISDMQSEILLLKKVIINLNKLCQTK